MKKLSFLTVVLALMVVFALSSQTPVLASTTIFSDNFNTGYSGWTVFDSANVSSVASPAIVPNSVQSKLDGSITRVVSTVGYTGVSVSWNLAGTGMVGSDRCYFEVDTGTGFTALGSLADPNDTKVFFPGSANNVPGADNNPNFTLRYRTAGDNIGDTCFFEDVTVTGTSGAATSTPSPTPPPATNTPTGGPLTVPGDPLTGSGAVSRTLLTYADLTTGSSTAPVDDSAFALPANAAMPTYTFEGRLQSTGAASNGGFTALKDTYHYAGSSDAPIKHIPEFNFEFVQNGSHLIPVTQGLVFTGHPNWNYIVWPGRVWRENGDNGYSRAAFPFALVQRNSNCTSNGEMTFLFTNTSVTKLRYQITTETCEYFQFNMWGQLPATYTAYTVANDFALKNNEALEVTNQLPTKPISALATDFPSSGVNTSVFGSGITAGHLATYGVVINGTNYVGGCATRYGQYAFCGSLRLPSYSTSKSALVSTAMMRLGQKYGTGVYSAIISNYFPEYTQSPSGIWTNVTFKNTVDMATGNYRLAGFESDESGSYENTFFLAEPYTDKVTAALNFPNKAAPGTKWIYHSHDMFILSRAESNYLNAQGGGADIFSMLVNEVYTPIKLSTGMMSSLRTDNASTGKVFGGYGLFWTQDDVAKAAILLNNNHGMANGSQILETSMLDTIFQKNSGDLGLDTGSNSGNASNQNFLYHDAFWEMPLNPNDGFTCSFWVPFMSGFGGITVAMAPNGATYYYFSDNDEFVWLNAIKETNKLSPMCH